MTSLSAHLREPGEHGRLAFHPECPLCRGRLSGALSAEAVVSRRAQAVVAAGVLALSAGSPTTVLAADQEREQEGAAGPDVAAPDAVTNADFDPGGASTVVQFDVAPTPHAHAAPDTDDEDAAPLEDEAATDAEGGVADVGDGSGTLGAAPQQAAQVDAPTTSVATPAQPADAPGAGSTEPRSGDASTPPDASEHQREQQRERAAQLDRAAPVPWAAPGDAPRATPQPEATDAPAATPRVDSVDLVRTTAEPAGAPSTSRQPNPAGRPGMAPQPEPADAPTTTPQPEPAEPPAAAHAARRDSAASPAPSVPESRRASRGDRVHVVLRGESLWSIARDLLGSGASVAAVAREVNRLWELNAVRIGTGDPDLLAAGTRLLLR